MPRLEPGGNRDGKGYSSKWDKFPFTAAHPYKPKRRKMKKAPAPIHKKK